MPFGAQVFFTPLGPTICWSYHLVTVLTLLCPHFLLLILFKFLDPSPLLFFLQAPLSSLLLYHYIVLVNSLPWLNPTFCLLWASIPATKCAREKKHNHAGQSHSKFLVIITSYGPITLPRYHSVKMSTHISANYTESRGWQTSSVKAKLELCCAGPSRLRVWLECFTVDTTPPQRRCLQLLSAGWIVDGYRRKALTGGSLGPHSHPQPWQGAALVSLFYFWTGGLTASLLATRFSWFLKTGSLPQPFFGY